jgi:hypothetical protein
MLWNTLVLIVGAFFLVLAGLWLVHWPRREKARVTAHSKRLGWREITPARLRELIFQFGKRREPALIIGPPGVGKTYAAKDLMDAGLLKGFEVITGCKDFTPDALFDAVLVISETAEKYVRMLPSLVRKHVGEWMIPIDECTPEEAMQRWPDNAWYLIIFDEATRATPAFIDALLPVCNDFQVTVEGQTFYAPVLVISLGNPAGMDASTAAFTHAYTSRQFARLTMYQPGPEEIAQTYSLPGVRRDAERLGIPPSSQPSEADAVLACAVITLLWGLPLDRKGMACLAADALDLIAEMEKRDPELAKLQRELGQLVHFSCDPRKGRRWLTTAQHEAASEGVPFGIDHLAATAVQCLAVGVKPTFSEGQEPHLQLRLEELIDEIARRALRSRALRELLAERARRRQGEESPELLADTVAPKLFDDGKARLPLLRRLLAQHERQLREDEVPDRELRTRGLAMFLRRGAALSPELPTADLHTGARTLAARTESAVLENGDFLTRADRQFFQEVANAGQLTAVGLALAALTRRADGMPTLLSVEEETRLACLTYRWVKPYEAELADCVKRHPVWRDRVEQAARVLDGALRLPAGADVSPVVALLFELFPMSGGTGSDPRLFFKDMFRVVQRHARRNYYETFERLAARLENLS